MRSPRVLSAALAVVCLTACGEGADPGERALAEVGDQVLTVNETVQLLSSLNGITNNADVVEAVAEIWTNLTVVAVAGAQDSLYADLDYSDMTELQAMSRAITAMIDGEVQADTLISDEELRQMYEEDAPGGRVRARHILLRFPGGVAPSDAQKDSIRGAIEAIRDRIVSGGEDFAEVATTESQDPGSAVAGGDLGFFTKPQMVPPFANAAFSLDVGVVSEPVESEFGFHLILVEERDVPPFEDVRDEARQSLISSRLAEAQNAFVDSVLSAREITVSEGSAEAAREVALRPYATLSRRAAGRGMAEYDGGAYTLGEFAQYVQMQPSQFRVQVQQAPPVQIEGFLEQMAGNEVLSDAAIELGYGVSEAGLDSIDTSLRDGFIQVTRQTGLAPIVPAAGETLDQAIERVITDQLRGMILGQNAEIPLAGVPAVLREDLGAEVNFAVVPDVVQRIADAQGPPGAPAPPLPTPTVQPPAPDTSGTGGDGNLP